MAGARRDPGRHGDRAQQVADSLPVPSVLRVLLRPILHRRIGGQAAAQGLQRLPLAVLVDARPAMGAWMRRVDEATRGS